MLSEEPGFLLLVGNIQESIRAGGCPDRASMGQRSTWAHGERSGPDPGLGTEEIRFLWTTD